jgi:ABC-type transport system involved in multi-copper enzyme maturation permease subunit
MTRILVIARNTFREAIRDRIYLAIFCFAGILLAATQVLSPLALGEGGKITRDFGLSSLVLLTLLVTVLVGTGLVHKEIERKTIMTLLSKPLGRGEFVIGKFLGLLWTLAVIFGAMLVMLMGLLYVKDGRFDVPVLLAACLSIGELVVITSVAIFFSTCTSPALSAMFTFAAYVAGHFAADLKTFAGQASSWIVSALANGAYYLFPNLELFNARGPAVHGIVPGVSQFGFAFLYAALYASAVLGAAVLVFRRREFR